MSLGKIPTTLGAPLYLFVEPLERVVRPDLAPVGGGELCEGQHIMFGGGHRLGGFGELRGEHVGDLVPADVHGVRVGEREDRPKRRGHHVLVCSWHHGVKVPHVVHAAAWVCSPDVAPLGRVVLI